MNSERRNQGLDLLRAFALLLVLFRHILRPMGGSPFRSNLILALNNGGWVGVDLFFVLSGFLIGGLLFDEQIASGGICIRRFYLRRGFKIYPLFWLTIAFLYLRSASSGNVPAPARVFHELLFLQNYLDGFRYVTWSLAVEEHFYLLLPLVLFCLAKGQSDPHRPYRYLPHAVAVVAAVCLACRLAVAHQRVNVLSHVTPTHLRIDGLFFGVLVAYGRHYFTASFSALCFKHRVWLWILGLVGLAPAFIIPLSSWYMRTFGFAVNWLAGGALVCAALTLPPSSSIYAQIAAALGRQSYATYLCHFWLGHEGLKAFADATGFDLDWNAYAVLYFVGSFMIGAILTCAIETPMLVLRNRLIPSWSAARRKAAGTTSTTPVSQPTPVLSPTSP